MWIFVSASTTRVFVAFSMVNFVLPFCRSLIVELTKWAAYRMILQVGDDRHGGCNAVPAATLSLPVPHLPGQTPDAPRHVLAAQGLQSSEGNVVDHV